MEIAPAPDNNGSLDDVERRHIESVLNQTNWMIEGERGAAKILDMNPARSAAGCRNWEFSDLLDLQVD